MPVHVFNKPRGLYEIRLDDGSIVSNPTENCIQPNLCGGWLIYMKCGHDNLYTAREIATGFETYANAGRGSTFTFVTDGIQANVAFAFGKEAAAAIFDSQLRVWHNFSALPVLQVLRTPGAGQKPQFLWIHNGRSVSGFEGTDPGQIVHNIRWKSLGLVEWVTWDKYSTATIPMYFDLWQRTVSPTGLGPIEQLAHHNVDRTNPTEPSWLRA